MRAIGPPFTEGETAQMIADCRSLVGRVRFRHMGRDPAIGLDCAGIMLWVFRKRGRDPVDLKAYGREPHKDGLRRMIETNLGDAIGDEMRAGDMALMRFNGAPRHVGLITTMADGRAGLLHVHAQNKIVAEHGLAGYCGDIVAVWRP